MKNSGLTIQTVATILISFLLLVVGLAIHDRLPDRRDLAITPFDYGANAPMIGEIFDVRASLAEEVNGNRSNGNWLVVDFSRVPDSSAAFDGRVRTADGTAYDAINSISLSFATNYPGLLEEHSLIFEVPKELSTQALSGAELVIVGLNSKMSPRANVTIGPVTVETSIEREGFLL